jgi:choice-of-anchor B domain-containing protein
MQGTGGFVFDDGTFVAEETGAYRVIASAGQTTAASIVEVTERPEPQPVELLDHGARAEVATSDLWVFEGADGEDYAYTGTHAQGGGERMFVWRVTDPTNVELLDSVVVDARVVNDVKVSDDASWAIITREGASTRRNGIVVLDLADPAHPSIMAELTDSLTGGIHNVWIMGDMVYAVNNGTSAMHIIDMSDPATPRHAGRFEIRPGETDKVLHDVWAQDGYAYLSYWDDGLVIADVGAGTHGGTPTEPAFVSSISYPQGNTHVAWRDRDYVFLGDEIGTADGMRGYIHVIDVSDIENPKEVAKYDLPEAGTHNVWVEDELLYIAYYQGGLRIVDVSGTLRGDLYRQGREIGFFRTEAAEGEGLAANSANAWGPQPFKGNLFVSDMTSGLWVVKHARPRPVS